MRLRFGTRRHPSNARGQSVVEFALLAPIMIFLLFAILDLSRVYTAMSSVESAAREAADYATAQGAERWSTTNFATTVSEMQRRACTAASELHDFAWTDADTDGTVDAGEACSNPSFHWCVADATGCSDPDDHTYPVDDPSDLVIDPNACDNPDRATPCTVTVRMDHRFHLFVPFQLNFFGVTLGLPVSLDFQRDSTFAMTDIDVGP